MKVVVISYAGLLSEKSISTHLKLTTFSITTLTNQPLLTSSQLAKSTLS